MWCGRDKEKSMHNRISSILSGERSVQRNFGTWNQTEAEDAEEIEYLLARAEVDLRAAQARVDELKKRLGKSQ
jgi:division protein CdvB (Snf7/Vps24/ESCRT-III family)